MNCDLLLYNISECVTCGNGPRRGEQMTKKESLRKCAVAIDKGIFLDIGDERDIVRKFKAQKEINCKNHALIPGFVDPHTHGVYAGNRIAEFELKIKGADYLEILAAGGGIISTMNATRAASTDELAAASIRRLDTMLAYGTTTAEMKTGYGLNLESELKILHVIEKLHREHPMLLVPTLLAAHAVPPEFRNNSSEYCKLITDHIIPKSMEWYRQSCFSSENIPFFQDVFVEKNAFDCEQARMIFSVGKKHGIGVKIHADEFTNMNAVDLAVELNAISVDHLDVTTEAQMVKLGKSETAAIVLPLVNFHFGSSHFADARSLIDRNAIVALSTDINPGSAPCASMQMAMAVSCRYQKLLPIEALHAATINAAYSIGVADKVGSIAAGKRADCLVVNDSDWRACCYNFGTNSIETIIKNGGIVQPAENSGV